MAILKLIPVIGQLIAYFDKKLNSVYIKKLSIENCTPYERGVKHGAVLKKEIQGLYRIILKFKSTESLTAKSKMYEETIPEDLIQEMQGLAKGANVPYEDVLFIHTFLDADPGSFGCSAMARKFGKNYEEQRIATANHKVDEEDPFDNGDPFSSHNRRKNLLESSGKTAQKILQSSSVDATVQSIIFNPHSKSIDLSSSEGNAAFESMQTFQSEELFGTKGRAEDPIRIQLLRNLDWPWYFLGQNTLSFDPID